MTTHHIDGHRHGMSSQDPGAGRYEIRVRGHLASRWAEWFDGMTLSRQEDGTTVLHGAVADQSALHGLLGKINNIGMPLVSVTLTAPDAPPTRRD
jgi:hypothetical protein